MGEGSLVVTIPKGWARFYHLRAGDKVEVVANGEILIRPIHGQPKDSSVDNGKSKATA